MKLLARLKNKNRSIVLVTHDLDDAKMADYIITLKDGEIVEDENVFF
ncbi:MAG: hypothetical protein RBQ97_02285 [Acholeplasma sp.]|nr:hypothetical protein [Acholeplasma sp.]